MRIAVAGFTKTFAGRFDPGRSLRPRTSPRPASPPRPMENCRSAGACGRTGETPSAAVIPSLLECRTRVRRARGLRLSDELLKIGRRCARLPERALTDLQGRFQDRGRAVRSRRCKSSGQRRSAISDEDDFQRRAVSQARFGAATTGGASRNCWDPLSAAANNGFHSRICLVMSSPISWTLPATPYSIIS